MDDLKYKFILNRYSFRYPWMVIGYVEDNFDNIHDIHNIIKYFNYKEYIHYDLIKLKYNWLKENHPEMLI